MRYMSGPDAELVKKKARLAAGFAMLLSSENQGAHVPGVYDWTLQPVSWQEHAPGATVVDVSVNGMLRLVAPAIVLVVLEIPGVFGITITAPSRIPPSVVPLNSVTFAEVTPALAPLIVMLVGLTA